MKKTLSLIILAGFLFSLTGCATHVGSKYEPSSQSNEGVVVFTVTQEKSIAATGREIMNFHFSGDALGYRKIIASSRSKWGSASEIQFDNAYGRIYALRFPAGVNQLNHWSLNTLFMNIRPAEALPALQFEVKPGSVTYIGNLHSKLLFTKNSLGSDIISGALPEIRNESTRDLKLILQRYPQFAGKIIVAPLPVGPWLPEKQDSHSTP